VRDFLFPFILSRISFVCCIVCMIKYIGSRWGGGDIYLSYQLIMSLGTILCHVGYPTGRRRCLGVVRNEATVVVSCVDGKQLHVVLCSSWTDVVLVLAIGWCFPLYPL
jgi:hypothetical protein